MTKIHLCLLDTPPSLWSCPLIGLNKCVLTPILVHLLLRYVLIGSSSVKNLGKDTLSNQKPSDKHENTRPAHARREDIRDESKGHPNNEHTASRQHDLVQTCLECNTQDIPVIVVESLDAVKGSGKGLREGKHMIPQIPPTVSSLPDRKMKSGVFNSCASRINRVLSGQDKVMFGIEEHIKGLELNGKVQSNQPTQVTRVKMGPF